MSRRPGAASPYVSGTDGSSSQRTSIRVSSACSERMSVRQLPCLRKPSRVATKGTSASARPNTWKSGGGCAGGAGRGQASWDGKKGRLEVGAAAVIQEGRLGAGRTSEDARGKLRRRRPFRGRRGQWRGGRQLCGGGGEMEEERTVPGGVVRRNRAAEAVAPPQERGGGRLCSEEQKQTSFKTAAARSSEQSAAQVNKADRAGGRRNGGQSHCCALASIPSSVSLSSRDMHTLLSLPATQQHQNISATLSQQRSSFVFTSSGASPDASSGEGRTTRATRQTRNSHHNRATLSNEACTAAGGCCAHAAPALLLHFAKAASKDRLF